MPLLAASSQVDITVSDDSTLTIQNPGGFARVEYPVGTSIAARGGSSWSVNIPSGTCRLVTLTGNAFYEMTSDPAPTSLTPAQVAATQALVSGAGIGSILQRSEAAYITNPYTQAPLVAVPAWTISTVVTAGQYLRANGNVYLCRTAGTTAGSGGGPAATHYADITDGTAAWQFVGPARAVATGQEVPTITFGAAPAVCSKAVTALAALSRFAVYGATPTVSGSGIIFPGFSTIQAGNIITTTPGKNTNNPAIEFITDSPIFTIQHNNTFTNLRRFLIKIDGRFYSDAPLQGDSGGIHMVFDFSAFVKRPRRIKLYWRGSANPAPDIFVGVNVDAVSQVWAPPASPVAVFLGDSLTQAATNYSGQNSGQEWPSQVSEMLGIDNSWNVAHGSAGFITTASGTRYRYIERLSDVTDRNPDLLVIAGNFNDRTQPVADQTAAVLEYLRAVRAACPYCYILVFGSMAFEQLAATNTDVLATDTALAAAVAAMNDPRVKFDSTLQDPGGPWTFGRRAPGNIAGITNANPGIISNSVAHLVTVGEAVVLHGVNGMDINGRRLRAVGVTTTGITTDLDTTSLGTFTTSAASWASVNDIWGSDDGVHPVQAGTDYQARRYAQGILQAMREWADAL